MENLGIEEDEMQNFLDAFCDSDVEWEDSAGTPSKIPESTKVYNASFACGDCGTTFIRYDNYRRHRRIHEKSDFLEELVCSLCKKMFARKDNLKRHLLTHKKSTPTVNECASSSTAVVNKVRFIF